MTATILKFEKKEKPVVVDVPKIRTIYVADMTLLEKAKLDIYGLVEQLNIAAKKSAQPFEYEIKNGCLFVVETTLKPMFDDITLQQMGFNYIFMKALELT